MGKVILTVGKTEYTLGNFNYSLSKRGCQPGEANDISFLKRMDCEGAEITSYSAGISQEGSCFTSVGFEVETLRGADFEARVKKQGGEGSYGDTA
jgi:hypothetical protein